MTDHHLAHIMKRRTYQRGMTYMQMAMAILVFGLLGGLILMAREFVSNAEHQRVIMEKDAFATAVYNFKDKYHKLPGDMPNATQVWGARHTLHATCITLAADDKKTCNGNGDGSIANWGNNAQYFEVFTFWQQLSNAGFLKEQFSGVGLVGPNFLQAQPGLNVPASKAIAGTGFGAVTRGPVPAADPDMFEGNYRHILFYGKQTASSLPWNPVFSPTQAAHFDTKTDDGKPGKGDIRSYKKGSGFNADCSSTDDPDTAVYDLSISGMTCSLIFVDVF